MPANALPCAPTPRSWPIMKPTAVSNTTVNSLTISTNTTNLRVSRGSAPGVRPQGSAGNPADLTSEGRNGAVAPDRRRLLRFGGLRRLRRSLGRRLRRSLGRGRLLRRRLRRSRSLRLARLRRRDRGRRLGERAVVVEVDRAPATGGRRLAEHLVELVLRGLLVDVQREREL